MRGELFRGRHMAGTIVHLLLSHGDRGIPAGFLP